MLSVCDVCLHLHMEGDPQNLVFFHFKINANGGLVVSFKDISAVSVCFGEREREREKEREGGSVCVSECECECVCVCVCVCVCLCVCVCVYVHVHVLYVWGDSPHLV